MTTSYVLSSYRNFDSHYCLTAYLLGNYRHRPLSISFFFLTTQGTQSILFALLLSGAQNTPAVLFYSVKSFNAHLFLNPPPFLFRLSLFGFSGFSSNYMLTNNILLLFTCLPYIFLLPVYMCFSIYTYSYIRYTTVYKTSFLATRHSLLSPPFHPKQSFL